MLKWSVATPEKAGIPVVSVPYVIKRVNKNPAKTGQALNIYEIKFKNYYGDKKIILIHDQYVLTTDRVSRLLLPKNKESLFIKVMKH